MFCIHCGKKHTSDSLYCEECSYFVEKQGHDIHRELQEFVGHKYPYYDRKWTVIEHTNREWSWNAAAAFFSIAWFGYRKHYVPAVVFLIFLIAIDAASYYLGWNIGIPFINKAPASVAAALIGMLGFGLFANSLYYRHALRSIYGLKAKGMADKGAEHYFIRIAGGTSRTGALVLLTLAVFLFFISRLLFPTHFDIIRTVQTSALYNYPLYSIGESFERYFDQPSWHYHRAPDGLELVEFHGYTAGSERTSVVVSFLVDYRLHEIEPYSLEINGELQEEDRFYKLMEDVFSLQNPFELDDELDGESEKNAL